MEKLADRAGQSVETITYERAKGAGEKRTLPAETFAHLPVKETIEIIPEPVRADPSLYERIGEERTFEVDLVPPQLFKRVIVRPKFRHCLDRSRAPLLAPAPQRIVTGGFASAGLVAWALTAKYCDHLPLYRQEKMLARWGAPISRQNLSDWVGAATALLEPIAKRMKQELLQSGYVQVDETPIRCHDPELRDGKTTPGWLWALSRPGGMSSSNGDYHVGTRRPSDCWVTFVARSSRTATRGMPRMSVPMLAWNGSAARPMRGDASSRRPPSGRRPRSACCD